MKSLSKHKLAAREAFALSLGKPASPTRKTILPAPTGEMKRQLDWERSVPRCENCKFITAARTIMHKSTASLPVVLVPPICQRGKFYTYDGAICKYWQGKDGTTLAAQSEGAP